MRNKDTGEFELVVGNGFLVSGFFVVILLFAVGVAMGYILGKNSEKAAQSQQTVAAAPSPTVDARPQPSQPAPTTQPVQTADAQPTPAADQPSQPATQPARDTRPTPTAQPAKQDPPKPTPTPAPPPKPTPAPAGDAPSGFFWQVAATANQEAARATLDTLSKAGFHPYETPGPGTLIRVIVGPFGDTPARAKAKTELEGMGFKPFAMTR